MEAWWPADPYQKTFTANITDLQLTVAKIVQ
jgi:hypothetical protein